MALQAISHSMPGEAPAGPRDPCSTCDEPTFAKKLLKDRFWNDLAHDFFWALKDVAWCSVYSTGITAFLAITTWLLTINACVTSARVVYRNKMIIRAAQPDIELDRAQREESIEMRLFLCNVTFLLWMTGSTIWCSAELFTFNTYGISTSIPEWSLQTVLSFFGVSTVLSAIVWIFIAWQEMLPTEQNYIDRLNDAGHVGKLDRGDRETRRRHVPFDLDPLVRDPYLKDVGLPTERMVVPERYDCYSPYMQGLPRFMHCPVRVPKDMCHIKTGVVKADHQWILTPLINVIDFRSFVCFLWIVKDVCWVSYFLIESPVATELIRIAWTVSVSGVLIAQLVLIYTLIVAYTRSGTYKTVIFSELIFLLWVMLNTTWACGEVYWTSAGEDFPFGEVSTPVEENVFPAWTPLSEIPEGQWQFRQVAMRIGSLIIAAYALVAVLLVVFDVKRLLARRRCPCKTQQTQGLLVARQE